MPKSGSGCRKTLKIGCLGCFGLLFLMVVISAIVFGVASFQARNAVIEKQELTQTLSSPETTLIEDAPLEVPTEFVVTRPAGRIILDLRDTTFDIRPARPGEPLTVKAEFDVNSYRITETLDEGLPEEGWTYEVNFRRTSSSYFMTVLKEALGGNKPRVVVSLPRDIPYDLDLSVMQGGAEVELGGLWLTNADIRFLQGGGAIEISEPLHAPADSLSIDFSQGGGAVEGVANASPSRLEVSFSMGGGFLDLEGTWLRDAEIDINQSMGGVTVRLPRDVIIRGITRPGVEVPERDDTGMPVLRFSTSSHYGELEFIR
jgi:hypothetical protein